MQNPQWPGPGQPRGLHEWRTPTLFQLADLLGNAPPAAAPPPVNPMDTSTWQSDTSRQLSGYPGMGGGEGSGGSPNSPNFTGIGTNPDGSVSRAGNTGLGNEQTPWGYDSNYGGILSALGTGVGMATGIPGIGTLGALAGTQIDRNNFAGVLSNAGLPAMGSFSLLGALTGTPWGSIAGRSARGQFEDARREGLGLGLGFNPALTGERGAPTAASANAQVDATLGSIAQTGYTNDPNYQAGSFGVDPGIATADAAAMAGVNSAIDAAMADGLGTNWAKGGPVRGHGLLNINPPGPDDIVGGLDRGEFVVRKSAASKFPGLLDAINRGAPKKELRGLLG